MKRLLSQIRSKHLMLIVLAPSILLITGCSRWTLFVVSNKSDRLIDVRYKIKQSRTDLLLVCAPPGVMLASRLGTDQRWQELSDSQYKLDRDNRLITVSLKPQEVLRISVIQTPQNEIDESSAADRFCAEEIEVIGEKGEIRFQGRQVYNGFKTESPELRSLTYK